MNVLFWVQNLLGVGHVVRAGLLAEALLARGNRVTIASGGFDRPDVPGAAIRPLPPVRATDQTFSTLQTANGPPNDAFWAQRTEALLAAHEEAAPDLVLLEAWPFGRRPFTREVETLLDRTKAQAAVSVRDILHANRKPGRAEETLHRLARVDLVLVHSDPGVARLEHTFPLAPRIACAVEHTGYVAPAGDARPVGDADVLVSAGGGAFGGPLMRAAAAAAALLPDRRFLLLTGPNLANAEREALARDAPPNCEVLTHVPNLAARMAGARASVSQAGYNTGVDVLRALAHGTAPVLVPSDVDGQTEQQERARRFEAAGRAIVLRESELTPPRLRDAIEEAERTTFDPAPVRLDGAARTAELLERLCA